MIENTTIVRENPFLSREDFINIYGRKPELLKISIKKRERDYHEYSRGNEAFFGENNEYKIILISLIAELRSVYQNAVSNQNDKKVRKNFANEIKPILNKIEKHAEKSFNISKCYFGIDEGFDARCFPLCYDSNLVTEKNGKRIINSKVKISLEDIAETKNGYKYKNPEGKIYCVSFGINLLDKYNDKDLFTDEECAAIITHEFGHSMQQAVCSINENLASVYTKALFDDAYKYLRPFVLFGSLFLSIIPAANSHKYFKEMSNSDPEELGDQIIIEEIGAKKEDYNRENLKDFMKVNTDKTINKLPRKNNKDMKVLKFFFRFVSFTLGGLLKILNELINSIFSIPSNIYALSQKGFLNKNRRFEQFADVFATSYGFGPALSSALAKLSNAITKQHYGLFNLINYVPVANIIVGAAHYNREAIERLVNGYPDTTGRMAAMYKSLKNELDSNKDLSEKDKKSILNQIDTMNSVYNDYVYDWSPKGFVYAIMHKIRFKTLKNEKSDVETNVLEALKEFSKEKKFTSKTKSEDKSDYNIDSTKLLSIMLTGVKNMKMNYGSSTKSILNVIEPELRKI